MTPLRRKIKDREQAACNLIIFLMKQDDIPAAIRGKIEQDVETLANECRELRRIKP